MSLDLVIRNGSLSTAEVESQPLDIGIAGGRIVELGPNISQDRRSEIDASGMEIFPGFIDPHPHMELPVSGTVSSDDFHTGTIAAACGGITTIIDFAGAMPGQS